MRRYCRLLLSYVVAFINPLILYRRGVILFYFLSLLVTGGAASAGDVWIKSFTGQPAGTAPNGYRYDYGVYGQDIQVTFNYTYTGTIDMQVSVNGGPYNAGFSCFWDDQSGDDAYCHVILPYACGKVTFRVKQDQLIPPDYISEPIEIFVFNGPDCVPQCDTCQLASDGGAAGKPVNVTTGKLWYQNEDIQFSGPQGLRFSRWYDNQTTYSRDMGYGWRHNYNSYLDLSVAGRIILFDEEGRRIYFNGLFAGGSVHDEITGADLALNNPATIYTLTFWNGAKMLFDSSGNLTAVKDRIGNTQTIVRNPAQANRITSVTDILGRSLSFGYDGQNRITSITSTPSGISLSYTYDTCGTGNLCTATMADGKTWQYQYMGSDPNNLTKVLDPLGHAEEINTYSSDKLTQQSTEGSQNVLNFSYSSGITTVTDGLNRPTTYNFDPTTLMLSSISGPGCGCSGGQTRSFVYDNLMRKKSETDGLGATHTITWAYARDVLSAPHFDGFIELIKSFPTPSSKTEPLSSGVNRTTSWTYYATNDLVRRDLIFTETVPSADTPGQNRVTTFNYDATFGLLTSQVVTGRINGVSTTYTTSFTYDTNNRGRLITINGPRTDVSDVTTYGYFLDTDTDFARRGQLQSITDAAGNVTTYAGATSPFNSYDLYGNPKSITDANNVVRTMTYDGRGRLLTSTVKGVVGDPADLTTTNTYRDDGQLSTVTFPLANSIKYVYDGSDRLTDTIRKGSNGNEYERLHVEFDVMSQKISEDAQSCSSPAPTCPTWVTQRQQDFLYDSYGRLWQIIHPDGFIRYLTYDAAGNLQNIQDERHSAPNIIYGYDYANRLISVTEKQTIVPGPDLLTQYGYDVHNNLSLLIDARSNQTTYNYDDFGRMRRVISPASGTTNYTHDPAGNILTETDSASVTVTRTYDAVNRLLTESYPDSAQNATYTYDESSSTFGKGRLTKRIDPSGTTTFNYERRGLPTGGRRTVDSTNFTTTFGYDGNGNRATMGYPSGTTYTYTFDFADRPVSISGGSPSIGISGATYKPFGPITFWNYGNGRNETRSYDLRYQLNSQIVSGSILNRTYGHDAAGNLNSLTDNIASINNRTFGYDDLNRLTTANGPWTSGSFSYDAIGNRLTKVVGANTTNYTYNTGGVYLQTASGAEPANYTTNGLGEITSDGTVTYGYDQRHHLNTIASTALTHSADSFRTKTATAAVTTRFFFSPEGSLIAAQRVTGLTVVWTNYVWLGDIPAAQVAGTTRQYITANPVGLPNRLTNSSGAIIWQTEEFPFGDLFSQSGSATMKLRFPGQYDESNNIYQNVWRFYFPKIGRYSQPDPLHFQARYYNPNVGGLVSAQNLYVYAKNAPTINIDPTGLRTCQSGQCPDCPGGHWIFGEGGGSAFLFGGGKAGGMLAVCTSKPVICAYSYSCWSVGMGWDLSVGGGGGITPFATCECAEDLAGRMVTLQGGGGSLEGELSLPTQGKCISASAGASAGPSLFLRVNVCRFTKKWCIR